MAGILEFLSAGLFTKNVDVDEDSIRWQNGLVGKLHAATGTILGLFTCTVFAKELLGDHIRCIRYTDDTQVSEATFNSYCYITETFSLPANQESVPHPGVGPIGQDSEVFHHSYYQWIPYLLFLQSASFYLPYMMNKFSHDNRITKLIQDLQNVIPYNENRQDKIGDIHLYTQDFFGSHGGWATKLVFSDFMNLVNIVFNIFIVDWYLKGKFFSYGPRVVDYQLDDVKSRGADPFNDIFPKMTKCTLDVYGPSGSIVNYDGLCVLPINVMNERIFFIIWFIFIPLFFLTVIEQVIWLFFVFNRRYRNKFLVAWILPKRKESKVAMWAVLNKIGFGDWLLLYMIARNIDRALFTTLADNIYPPGSGYYPEEDEEDPPRTGFTSDSGEFSERQKNIAKNF
eukprot:TRINITY_DN27054_c0_g1_i1.p1 TRINITY_DN27054_c0_g1~~TRINITY_DN27054_c0_g1_i1.p1  ORF type:complete len:398 (+),score=116.55 TRINITY_DN27054_c0_g1_i1:132-1325(+)